MTAVSHRIYLYTLLAVLLTACSGGGGGSGSSPAQPAPTTPPPNPPANEAPSAAFTMTPVSGTAPLVVTVDASGSADSDGQIASYAWDFGVETAIGQVAQYTFVEPGNYTVSLTVTDNDGALDNTASNVVVSASAATSTLSGTVKILNSTAVDADVNDRLTVPVENDTFDSAQPLPVPVTLGGFANVPGGGEDTGNLFTSGDPGDFYQINLNGDEIIVLTIADSSADLDLRLWDSQRNIVDASLGVTATETIQAPPAGGSYYVEVLPFSGASNYVLYIGLDVSATAARRTPTRMSDPFIPGQLIVKPRQHKPGRNLKGMRTLSLEYETPRGLPGPGLYALADVPSETLKLPASGKLTATQRLRLQTLTELKSVARSPDVAYAELNMLAQAHATPDDSFYGSQWHYPAINLPTAWDTTTGSSNVIVAVVDSGVLTGHPDLQNKLVSGYDFISDANRSLDGDGLDPDPNDPGDLEFGGSSSFHGTHVAGTIGAESNNGRGVAGVAWQTSIMPLRALGKDGGSTFDVIQAVRFAAGLSNNSGTLPAQRADIINLSLGSSFSSQSEQDTYTEAMQAGVIIVASAGNDASSLPSYPADYQGVISVSATTITNGFAPYSNFGSSVDIAAPGGSNLSDLNGDGIGDGVISTMGDDSSTGPIEFGYLALSGTSMAAPHVAGTIALMKAVHPALTPAEFEAALLAGNVTDDLGPAGRDDQYGWGLINAQKAVITAQQLANGQGSDPGPILTASASTLNFGGFLDTLALTLQNIGTGDINVGSVSASESWVSVTPPASADGLGSYAIAVNRDRLSDGAYQATLSFDSDANDIEVTLIMQVSSLSATADAGLFYVILVDENGETAATELVSADQGEYPFTINDVAAGQYRLFAGSDADDDSILCDAGEACGAYSTLDAPDLIPVNGDLSGLDFESGFRVTLTTGSQGQVEGKPGRGIAIDKPRVPVSATSEDNR